MYNARNASLGKTSPPGGITDIEGLRQRDLAREVECQWKGVHEVRAIWLAVYVGSVKIRSEDEESIRVR